MERPRSTTALLGDFWRLFARCLGLAALVEAGRFSVLVGS